MRFSHYPRQSVRAALAVFLVAAVLALGGCKTEPLPVPPPPPPPKSSINPPASVPAPTQPPATSAETADPSLAPPEAPPPALTAETLAATVNKATVAFPDKITFSLTATSPVTIRTVTLRYGSDEHTLVPQTNSSVPEFMESKDVNVNWAWEMKKTGSIPPGATIWWQWELTDADGKTEVLARQTMTYMDTRFQWRSRQMKDMDLYWHDQSDAMIEELLAAIEARLARIQLNVNIPVERKPRVFVYRSSEELKGAMLHEQQWTGAVAFPNYNIVLTAVSAGTLEWAKGALPHEITHLIVGEAVFGPFGDIPTWLDEGLAEYSEGEQPDYQQQSLSNAIRDNRLISVRSLASGFPADPAQAYLAYAEAASIVKYLVETYGWEKMRQLLAIFKDGATYDKALQSVYGFDQNGLESAWKTSIGVFQSKPATIPE